MDRLAGDLRIELHPSSFPTVAGTEVRVTGKINSTTSLAFQEALELAMEPGRVVLVDLGEVEVLESAGFKALMAAAARIRHVRGELWLRCPTSAPTPHRPIGFLADGEVPRIVDRSQRVPARTGAETGEPHVKAATGSEPGEVVRHLFAAALALHSYRSEGVLPRIGKELDQLTEDLDSMIKAFRRTVLDQSLDAPMPDEP